MLREIYILRGNEVLFWRQYGTAIKWDDIAPIFLSIIKTLKGKNQNINKINYITIQKYKIIYITYLELNLFFFMISDLTDNDNDLENQIQILKNEFLDLYSEIIPTATNPEIFNSFNPIADKIHKDLRPKIALVGFSGVGKTTIVRLIRAEEIPMTHVATMTGDIVTVKIGKLFFNLWDFAGQESFSFLWPDFIKDSDAVLIVTDSQLKNIDESKFFIDLVKSEVPNARCAAIANKQDLPNALAPEEVSRILNLPTYGMVAVDVNNRSKMIKIIAELMDLSEQISPLLKPLIERDKQMEAAEKSLEEGDLLSAAEHLEVVANLSFELGDDVQISNELLNKARRLREEAGVLTEHQNIIDTPIEIFNPEKQKETQNIKKMIESIETQIADLELQRQRGLISEHHYSEESKKLKEKQEELIEKLNSS
ncbi:MAG: ADP-ribosylation factor-like protein [Candidatus Helarchaeota archaeon]